MCGKFTSKLLLVLSSSLINILPVCAQNTPDFNKGIKINIKNKEDHYVRLMPRNQVWARVINYNPCTSSVQPFTAYSLKSMDAPQQDADDWGIDSNFIINPPHAMASFQYARGLVYCATDLVDDYRRPER
jgi:hypothetical protein